MMVKSSELRAAANRMSVWGIASLVLLVGGRGFGEYNLYVYDTASKKTRAITNYGDQGVRAASVFGDTAAYVRAGRHDDARRLTAGRGQGLRGPNVAYRSRGRTVTVWTAPSRHTESSSGWPTGCAQRRR